MIVSMLTAVDDKMEEWRRSRSEKPPTAAEVASKTSNTRKMLTKRKIDALRVEHFSDGSNATKARPSETTAYVAVFYR